MRTRIKMCGFTRSEDVLAAIALGVDALGFVFYPPSSRCLDLSAAVELAQLVPAFVAKVALFVNPNAEDVRVIIAQTKPDLLQFHGDETVEFCEQFGIPYLKAFRVGAPELSTDAEILQACRRFSSARGYLFDSYSDAYGGSGRTFDWTLLKNVDHRRLVLSGGLHAGNVREAMNQVKPFSLDISSGIELHKGVKCHTKMHEFVQQVRLQDSAC